MSAPAVWLVKIGCTLMVQGACICAMWTLAFGSVAAGAMLGVLFVLLMAEAIRTDCFKANTSRRSDSGGGS